MIWVDLVLYFYEDLPIEIRDSDDFDSENHGLDNKEFCYETTDNDNSNFLYDQIWFDLDRMIYVSYLEKRNPESKIVTLRN